MKMSKVMFLVLSLSVAQATYPITFAEMKAKIQAKVNSMSDKVKTMIASIDIKKMTDKVKSTLGRDDVKALADKAKKFADMAAEAATGKISDEMKTLIPNLMELQSNEERVELVKSTAVRMAKELANEVFNKTAGKSDNTSVDAKAIAEVADEKATNIEKK